MRQAKRGDFGERGRRTAERIRKKEIEDLPAPASDGSVYCYASYEASGSFNPYISNPYVVWPLDTIDAQSGGFSIAPADGYRGSTDTRQVAVPSDGLYRLTFQACITFMNFGSAGHASWVNALTLLEATPYDVSGGHLDTQVLNVKDAELQDALDDPDLWMLNATAVLPVAAGEKVDALTNFLGFQEHASSHSGLSTGALGISGPGAGYAYGLLIEKIA